MEAQHGEWFFIEQKGTRQKVRSACRRACGIWLRNALFPGFKEGKKYCCVSFPRRSFQWEIIKKIQSENYLTLSPFTNNCSKAVAYVADVAIFFFSVITEIQLQQKADKGFKRSCRSARTVLEWIEWFERRGIEVSDKVEHSTGTFSKYFGLGVRQDKKGIFYVKLHALEFSLC